MIVEVQNPGVPPREKWRQGDILEDLQPGVHTPRFHLICRYRQKFFLADLPSGQWYDDGGCSLETLQADNEDRFRVYRGTLSISNGDT